MIESECRHSHIVNECRRQYRRKCCHWRGQKKEEYVILLDGHEMNRLKLSERIYDGNDVSHRSDVIETYISMVCTD